jgi:hypothetical protein
MTDIHTFSGVAYLDSDLLLESSKLFEVISNLAIDQREKDLALHGAVDRTLTDITRRCYNDDNVMKIVTEIKKLFTKYNIYYDDLIGYVQDYCDFICGIKDELGHGKPAQADIDKCNESIRREKQKMKKMLSDKDNLDHEKEQLYEKAKLNKVYIFTQ